MSSAANSPGSDIAPATRDFFLWALAAMDAPVDRCPDGRYHLQIPADSPLSRLGVDEVYFHFDTDGPRDASNALLDVDAELAGQIFAWFEQAGEPLHAVPRDQPASVHELTPRLFAAYQVAEGSVRLGGCRLEDEPLLRFTFRSRSGSERSQLVHRYAAPNGNPVDPKLLAELHVDQLEPLESKPPRLAAAEVERWRQMGRQSSRDGTGETLILLTIIWCKYVQGKLIFEIGRGRGEVPFEGWAQSLVDASQQPPPYTCPVTGLKSYQVVSTDDGRVTVPEAITECEWSGRRCLHSDLVPCDVSGRKVMAEYLVQCPVTGQRVLRAELVTCDMCRQQVSRTTLERGRCAACRAMVSVHREDPRLALVFGEHPKLDQWSGWRIGETQTVYILTAASFLRCLLVVIDKESLAARHIGERSKFTRHWSEMPSGQWLEVLG